MVATRINTTVDKEIGDMLRTEDEEDPNRGTKNPFTPYLYGDLMKLYVTSAQSMKIVDSWGLNFFASRRPDRTLSGRKGSRCRSAPPACASQPFSDAAIVCHVS